ncbi:MAG: hypothetical protein ACTHNU_13465 [Gaiellales bacterium]
MALAMVSLVAPQAIASQMITRDAKYPSIKAGVLRGEKVAAVTYYASGAWHHVLVWGAENARPYSTSVHQVEFKVNFSGGYGSLFGINAWKKLSNQCVADKPLKSSLPLAVAACTMKTNPHEHWALQVWQRTLPDAGVKPRTSLQRAFELHVSHWTDAYMPVLWLKWGWSNAGPTLHYDHLYGVMSSDAFRVYGHSSTAVGNPTDSYGRNIYVDAQNPVWGHDGAYVQPGGWVRFNAFLTHFPRGDFCASVYKTNLGVARPGYDAATRYRATAMGPGVTPIVRWSGPPPGTYAAGGFPGGFSFAPVVFPGAGRGAYDPTQALQLNDEQRSIAGSADTCYKVYGPHS